MMARLVHVLSLQLAEVPLFWSTFVCADADMEAGSRGSRLMAKCAATSKALTGELLCVAMLEVHATCRRTCV